MSGMETPTLDKLYLEWSHHTKAKTARELTVANRADAIMNIVFNDTKSIESKLNRIYDHARKIYEDCERKPHYWHREDES